MGNSRKNSGALLILNLIIASVMMFSFFSCSTIPEGVVAVKPFFREKYLGNWFEIARKDFKYERGLNNTTAEYTLNKDGTIRVRNQGYNVKEMKWTQAIGKAKFAGGESEARLKVSFFGPFYSGYNVIAIDDEYRYALVAGESLKYLWILSREVTIPAEIKEKYLKIAEKAGYNTADLIWVKHDKEK